MILCDSCQRKSCNKILSYNVPVCDDFTPPPLDVKVGDIIEIQFGQKNVKVKVLNIADTTKKDEAKDLFEYIA